MNGAFDDYRYGFTNQLFNIMFYKFFFDKSIT